MIGFLIFKLCLIATTIIMVIQLARYFFHRRKFKERKLVMLDWMGAAFYSKFVMMFLIIAAITFLSCSVTPYLLNKSDEATIKSYSNSAYNVEQYLEVYVPEAEKNRMDPELVAARAAQLRDRILDQQLVIFKAKARIEHRKNNKWFFLLEH